MQHKRIVLVLFVVVLAMLFGVVSITAQGPQPRTSVSVVTLGTGFTYQGQLKSSGAPVNGNCDFQFALYDALTLGARIGATQTVSSLAVTNGLFATPIDFGAGAFTGDARFLNMQVSCPAGGAFTALNPRQTLTPAPMALALPGLWTQQNATSPNLIGGYSGNVISPTVVGGTIGGGGANGNINRVTDYFGTVGGGDNNTASGYEATVGGGRSNTASGFAATVGGGQSNTASDFAATVGGGNLNTASGSRATVGGGDGNSASGFAATVPGGYNNTASGDNSFAAGNRAKAQHDGSFIWADDNPFDFSSAVSNTFKVRATNGIRMVVQIDGSGAPTVSCLLNSSTVSWSCSSDRNVKENFSAVDPRAVLRQVSGLPITQWSIIGGDPRVMHIGPMAQDFYAAFGLGADDKTIGTVDAQGVALAAIQGLHQIVQEKDARITQLESDNAALKARVDSLDARLTALEQRVSSAPTLAGTMSLAPEWLLISGIMFVGMVLARRFGFGGKK
ncbi:MAG: tail fiber domain-containing protein [Chloroflexota bacterium]